MRGVEGVEGPTPVHARRHRLAGSVAQQPGRVVAVEAAARARDERREPQPGRDTGGADARRQALHAGAEGVVGLPVADGPLPAVVDLEGVEGQAPQPVEHLEQSVLGDVAVEAVPARPQARRGGGAAPPEALGEPLGVGAEHLRLRPERHEPVPRALLVGALEAALIGLDARVEIERAEQQHAVGRGEGAHPAAAVAAGLGVAGIVPLRAARGRLDGPYRLAELEPARLAPALPAVPVEARGAAAGQGEPLGAEPEAARHRLGAGRQLGRSEPHGRLLIGVAHRGSLSSGRSSGSPCARPQSTECRSRTRSRTASRAAAGQQQDAAGPDSSEPGRRGPC